MIDPVSGHITAAKIFDTYQSPEGFDKFLDTHDFPAGQLVIAACKDDCITRMSGKGKQFFSDMGSQEIWDLQYRQAFVFIGIIGKVRANEKRARSRKDPVSVLEAFEFEEIFGGQRLNKMHLAEMCPMNIIEVAEEIVHKIIDDVEHIHWIHSKKAWGAIITTLTGIIYLNFDRMTFMHSERKLKADRQKRFKAKLRRLY